MTYVCHIKRSWVVALTNWGVNGASSHHICSTCDYESRVNRHTFICVSPKCCHILSNTRARARCGTADKQPVSYSLLSDDKTKLMNPPPLPVKTLVQNSDYCIHFVKS